MSIVTIYYVLIILLSITLIGFHFQRMRGVAAAKGLHMKILWPDILQASLYVIPLVLFIQLSFGNRWEGQYILPIRNLHIIAEDSFSPVKILILVVLAVMMLLISTFRGTMAFLKSLFKRRVSESNREHMQLAIMMAVVLVVIQSSFLPNGLFDSMNAAILDIQKQKTEEVNDSYQKKIEAASKLSGSISDKYECVNCSRTDGSPLWIGRIPMVTSSEKNSLYLIRVNDTVFSIDKREWKKLQTGDRVTVIFTQRKVMKVNLE
ncbi:hypothetical protein [Paenibacillus sp. Leaf72]|uniref:hypothetical protein n=1 Tax=Paenibacillus sp. Leaf72 TaxID=1736234 RepID=UPI000700CD74|nr:hypothetical protein [Paenibacillus sp. Leaf72]KQN96930.1 hypothetical protein ASF12_22945 [Paenibacillus sp. Leaf72]